jgi:hypothetical protein
MKLPCTTGQAKTAVKTRSKRGQNGDRVGFPISPAHPRKCFCVLRQLQQHPFDIETDSNSSINKLASSSREGQARFAINHSLGARRGT